MKDIIHTTHAPAPIGPYSQAVRSGQTLYCSGQIAIDPATGTYTPADAAAETVLVMKNIGALLSAAGLDFSHIVKTSIFLQDMNDFAAVNEVYGRHFEGAYPARETVQVAMLPKGARVEISVVACY